MTGLLALCRVLEMPLAELLRDADPDDRQALGLAIGLGPAAGETQA